MRGARRTGSVTLVAAILAGCAAAPAGGPQQVPWVDPTLPPAATPLPGADEAEAAVRAFAQLIAREDLSFHVVEAISTTGGGVEAEITLDVAGSDFAATVTSPGVKRIELRHVGGATFARIGTGRWRSGTADERLLDDLTDPWLYLCWLDHLEYTGPAGDPADGLAFACGAPYSYQSTMMRQQGQVGRIEHLTLVLAADGTPVAMDIAGAGPTLATEDETFKATLAFSRVDERIVVKVPKK
jgi:hypothetical protein